MPPSTSRLHGAGQGRTAVRAPKEPACRTFLMCCSGRAHAGAASPCRAGMAKEIAWLSSARPRPCGAMAECPSCRSAGSCCAIPLKRFSPPGPAVHRSHARSAADHPLVHLALAGRGHLPGGAGASGRGDPAAMVGSCRRPHHALLLGLFSIVTLLAAPNSGQARPHGCFDRQLVSQVSSDFCGCSRGRAASARSGSDDAPPGLPSLTSRSATPQRLRSTMERQFQRPMSKPSRGAHPARLGLRRLSEAACHPA